MEMPNLYPHHLAFPDHMVADSLFVTSHVSLTYINKTLERNTIFSRPQLHVISSGLNITERHLLSYNKNILCPDIVQHKMIHTSVLNKNRCEDITNVSRIYKLCKDETNMNNITTIGIVGRLSEEKSIGLFILSAAILLNHNNNFRFVVIGDGPLRGHLESLTKRLNISQYVLFLGWVNNNDLPVYLSGFDMAVTTGAWRETFSIVGLDHLAMGVPLVTYAAGGMGEYIDNPFNEQYNSFRYIIQKFVNDYSLMLCDSNIYNTDSEHNITAVLPFLISSNAVVVIDTTPCALALAIMFLSENNEIRSNIGYNGINTVKNYFTLEKSGDAYDQLYTMLRRKRYN
jgi:glycosyltransferase involved in cell wall biosynthesis